MEIYKILFIFCFMHSVAGKICSSNSVIPFSGYKITRRHKIRLRPLKSDSFLVLTKCHRGIPVFSRTVHTSSSQDEFAVPFRDLHTEFDFLDRWREDRRGDLNGTKPGSGQAPVAEKIATSFQMHKHKLREWLLSLKQKKKEKGDPESLEHTDLSNNDTDFLVEVNSVLLHIPKKGRRKKHRQMPVPPTCLKMARRKRYAKLNVVIFIPATFVGVLYSCGPTEVPTNFNGNNQGQGFEAHTLKRRKTQRLGYNGTASKTKENGLMVVKVSKRKNHGVLLKSPESEDSFMGSPMCPLVADDYSSHWLSVQLSPPALIYHVPYLRSPSVWDPRFRSSIAQEAPKWEDDVDINEQYVYTDSDLSLIGEALAASTKYVQRLFDVKRNRITKLIALKTQLLQKFDPRLQFSLILFSVGKSKALRHVVRLQRLWDNRLWGNATVS